MKKKVCAVTVSQNYIERKKYSIKYLMIGQRKCGHPFWYVRHIGKTGIFRDALEIEAVKYGFENNIPYVVDVRHGDNVTKHERSLLKKYGVAV